MEEWSVSIGENEYPLFAKLDLDAINRLLATLSILLAEDAHDLALIFPGTGYLGTNEVVWWQIIDDLRELHIVGCQQFKDFSNGQHAIKSRLQGGNDKATVAIANQNDVISRSCAHQGMWHDLGGQHLAAIALSHLLDGTGRCNRRGDNAAAHRAGDKISERCQELAAIQHAPAIINDIDTLAAGIQAHAEISIERRGDRSQDGHIALELFCGARKLGLVPAGVEGDDIAAQFVEDGWKHQHAAAMSIIDDDAIATLFGGFSIDDTEKAFPVALDDLWRVLDDADVIEVDAAEILAEEKVFDLAFGGLIDVQAMLIEEFDV